MKFWKFLIIVCSIFLMSLHVFAADGVETSDTRFFFYTNSGLKNNLSLWNVETGKDYSFWGRFVNNWDDNLRLYIWFVDWITDSDGNYLWCKNEWDWTYFGDYVQISSSSNLSWNILTLPWNTTVDVQFMLSIPWWYNYLWNHVWCVTHYVLWTSWDDSSFTTLSRKWNFVNISVVKHEIRPSGWWNWGWGWAILKKDKCPDWDFSDSYYDNDCWDVSKVHNAPGYDKSYSDEMNEAYQYCYSKWVTTMYPIWQANMGWYLTRIAMAKMLSKYAINVLWLRPDTTRQNKFKDVSDELDAAYNDWVTLAYQLWIMWINMPNNEFRPFDLVPRSEFVTAFSRMKYKTTDGQYVMTAKYYTNHMNNLVEKWIITNPNPSMLEIRGYVMLILMRSAKTD